jgi:transcription elongation factor SPT6
MEKKLTECVFMGPGGEYKSHISLQFSPKTRENDCKELKKFIEKYSPSVIALGTTNYQSRYFFADLITITGDIEREGLIKVPEIHWIDSEISEIYLSSSEAIKEFKKLNLSKKYNPNIERALSIGRRLLNPIIELSKLCNSKHEICCLELHLLQDIIDQELLYNRLNRIFISLFNAIGVDINDILRNRDRKSHILSFISGLGPRKANNLLQTIKSNTNLITSRSKLLKFMGEIVGKNAIGFIKFSKEDIMKNNSSNNNNDNIVIDDENQLGYEILDITRIHPDDYSFASKIASDAIGKDTNNYIEEIMQSPEELEGIDLDMFSELIEINFNQKKLHTLYDIKNELIDPYTDHREPYTQMSGEKLFDLLTNTTIDTLYIGMFVKCRIFMRKSILSFLLTLFLLLLLSSFFILLLLLLLHFSFLFHYLK